MLPAGVVEDNELVPAGECELPAAGRPDVRVDTCEQPRTTADKVDEPHRPERARATRQLVCEPAPVRRERRPVALRGELAGMGSVRARDPDGRLLALDPLVRQPGAGGLLTGAARDDRHKRGQRNRPGRATPP